jgi:hypothetical protein
MRYWQFGIFDAHAADFDADGWGGKSILVWGNLSNTEDTPGDFNTEYVAVGHGVGVDLFRNQVLVNIGLAQIKAKLGQIPVLLRTDLNLTAYSADTGFALHVYRMYKGWDIGDTSNRYSDRSALTTWYGDAYAPYPGQDRTTDKLWDGASAAVAANDVLTAEVTTAVERALRDNVDIRLMLMGQNTSSNFLNTNWKPPITTKRPNLEFYYLYPIEFYESVGGVLDYTSTVQESEDGHYYLGAVERNSTGAATQGWIRNYTTSTQQVEIFDDHAEWTNPVQIAGTGTGQLDYVTLAENATSQLYTVQFYSSTQYEVKAEAYRDNAVGYHPQYDANGSWRSDTSSTWVSPSGGLTISAAMWQGANINSGDEFEIGVRGNTTDTSWPADGNDQVQMTFNNAGSPDATKWRPAVARRDTLTKAVTIDAASKFFSLRHVVPAEWVAGVPCFVHDATNYDEGTITSTQERALPAFTFTGSGLDDCTISGNYNGNQDNDYRVVIDATGTPDTFSWSRTGDATYVATGVAITGAAQLLENGVYVTFAATTGHTVTDRWDSAAKTWGVTVGGLSVTSNAYSVGAVVATSLPLRDLAPADWSTVSAASGASQGIASRIYLADTTPFTQGDVVFVQQVQASGVSESATIASGGVQSTYIDLTTSLVNDYAVGDFCTVKGSGEVAFWMRPVSTPTTIEELKRLRFNARIL